MKSVIERLAAAEDALRRNEPERLTVTLSDGSTSIEDAVTVWRFFTDKNLRKQVVSISANQPGYVELAGVVEILCQS